MAKTVVIAFALLLATVWFAKAAPSWTRQFDSAVCRVPVAAAEAGPKVADVLCCCKTHTGGECCMRATQCGGKPPGCFCASPSVPGALGLGLLRWMIPKRFTDSRDAGVEVIEVT